MTLCWECCLPYILHIPRCCWKTGIISNILYKWFPKEFPEHLGEYEKIDFCIFFSLRSCVWLHTILCISNTEIQSHTPWWPGSWGKRLSTDNPLAFFKAFLSLSYSGPNGKVSEQYRWTTLLERKEEGRQHQKKIAFFELRKWKVPINYFLGKWLWDLVKGDGVCGELVERLMWGRADVIWIVYQWRSGFDSYVQTSCWCCFVWFVVVFFKGRKLTLLHCSANAQRHPCEQMFTRVQDQSRMKFRHQQTSKPWT